MRRRNEATCFAFIKDVMIALIIVTSAVVNVEICRGEVLLERQLFDLHNVESITVACEAGAFIEHVSEITSIELSIMYEGYIPAMQIQSCKSTLQGARMYVFTHDNCAEFYEGIEVSVHWWPDYLPSGTMVVQQSLEASSYYIDQDDPWFVTIYLETNCDCMLERETHFDNLRIVLRVNGIFDSTGNQSTSFSFIKTLYK